MILALNPAITVLMPVRNGAAYVMEAVASILAQDFTDFEFLIIDDGSSDVTPRLLAAIGDPRVRVITTPPLGLVPALNRGLQEARAPYVARMDADDVAAPARLRLQCAVLDQDPALALVASGWRVIGPDGAVRRVVRPSPDWVAALGRRNGIAHASVMFRRDMVRNHGGYRTAFPLAEDYDLWRRLAEHHPMAALPEPLLDYREHAGQSTLAGLERRILSELAVHEAAALRARGEPDGMDGPAPAMPSAASVRDGMLPRALGAAVDAVAAGHGAAARAAIRLAWRQPGLRLRTRAHLLLLRLLIVRQQAVR